MTLVYHQNLATVSNRWPHIAQALEECDCTALSFEIIEKHAVTLKVEGVQLSSAYDPFEEAFSYRSITSGDTYHIWGLGLGHVPALLSQDQNARSVTLYLYNLPLAKLVLSLIPAPWLADTRFELVTVEKNDADINQKLGTLSHVGCIIINGDKSISRVTHQWLYYRMENRLTLSHSNRVLIGQDERFKKIEHLNYPVLSSLPSIDDFARSHIIDEAVCIGAGPSLAHHIQELKNLYDTPNRPAFIAAATACKCLLENGIKPDVVYAIDIDIPASYIPFSIADSTVFVFASRIPLEIIEQWQGEKYYLHTCDETYDRYAQTLPTVFRPYIYGSVIHPLIHTTLVQGAKQITLIGCDFGFPDDIVHAGMVNDPNDPNSEMGTWVENGHGELIKTSSTYRMFGTGVENLISANPDTRFYNWSRMGARILGAAYLDEDELYV